MSGSKSSSSTPTPSTLSSQSGQLDAPESPESLHIQMIANTAPGDGDITWDLHVTGSNEETPVSSKPPTPVSDEMLDESDLIKLCENGDVQAMKRTLSQTSRLVNIKISNEETGRLINAILSHGGSKSTEILGLLLENGLQLSSIVDQDGNTLLHIAAGRGKLDVASKMLYHESQRVDTSASVPNLLRLMNRGGYTPFGMATVESKYSIAIEILQHASGDPTSAIPDFKKLFFPKFRTDPLDKPVKVYFLGDAQAGKSTLIQLLQDKKGIPPFELVRRLIGKQAKNVGTHFGGLITNDFYEAGSKRVIFCDLAGNINFFSRELFESSDKLESIIFVIVINLGETKENMTERLWYWLSFLHFYTGMSVHQLDADTVKPNVVVVASHKGKGSTDQLAEVYSQVRTEAMCNFLTDDKFFVLDCTKIKSVNAQALRDAMKGYYEIVQRPFQDQSTPSSICYILSEILNDSKRFPPIMRLGDITKKISEFATGSGLNYYKLLPTDPTKLLEMCTMLSEHERLCLFDNPDGDNIEGKWIMHGIHVVLTEMDNCLRAAVVDRSTIKDHHYGIVTKEALKSILSKSSSMPKWDINVAMEVLQHFKYCEPVQLQEECQGKPVQYFFPNLLLLEHPGVDQIGWDDRSFGFAWCVAASKQQDGHIRFFLPRFLKKLQLSLIQKYIPLPSSYSQELPVDNEISSSNKVMAVWSRGVSWVNNDQIYVNITMNDNSIILSMRCRRNTDSELNCLQLRNNILSMIREQKKKFQNEIKTEEFLIQCSDDFSLPIHYFDAEHALPVNEIRTEIIFGEHPDYLDFLLYFEPCASLAELTQSTQAYLIHEEHSSTPLSNEMLEEIYSKFGGYRAVITRHFNLLDPCATPTLSVASTMTPSEYEGSLTGHSKPIPVRNPDDHVVTSPKKLLSCLDSISIMNTIEFLQEHMAIAHSNSKPTKKESTTVIEKNEMTHPNMPLVEPPQVFTCDSSGKRCTIDGHDIVVSVPPGAVTKGSPITITTGVLLSGPFIFQSGQKNFPVSPIIHLSVQGKLHIGLKKPITLTFPHFLDQMSQNLESLAIFRAPYVDSAASNEFVESEASQLQVSANGKILCEVDEGDGFFCVAHKSPEKLNQASLRYYLHTLEKSDRSSCTHTVEFFVTYALNTFHRIIRKQYSMWNVKKREIKLALNEEASSAGDSTIEIDFKLKQSNGWLVYNESGESQILASDIDFWNLDRGMDWYDDLEHSTTYPPRFTIAADGSCANRNAVLEVTFSGLNKKYQPNFRLHCINRSSSVHSLSSPMTDVTVGSIIDSHLKVLMDCLDIPQIRSWLKQYKVVNSEEHQQLINFGDTPSRSAKETLFNMLRTKGVKGLYHFMEALKSTTNGTGHQDILSEFQEDPDVDRLITNYLSSRS